MSRTSSTAAGGGRDATFPAGPSLLAISDLHIHYPENRAIAEGLRPESDGDWLILAGDVGEYAAEIEWALTTLSRRFAKVIWVPGNHELWTLPDDPLQLRGEERYQHLVSVCRRLGVITPEDPYPIWEGEGGPVVVAPLFLLYDYSFTVPGVTGKEQALKHAHKAGVMCTDEVLLHPDPYPTREDWCRARLAETERRLAALDPGLRTVLVNHWPLVREPTRVLWYPDFALWCGTEHTVLWHVKFRATEVVYGHLHIPRALWQDGVRFTEVSLGYPREWRRQTDGPRGLRRILPASSDDGIQPSAEGALPAD